MEVNKNGKRRVFWDCYNCGGQAVNWVAWGTKSA